MTIEIVLGEGRSAFPAELPDGTFAGYRVTHPACSYAPNSDTGSWIPVGEDGWTRINEDPLHLEPSLLCRICGDHGFIREGEWCPV